MTFAATLAVSVTVLVTAFLSGIFGMAGGMILMGALLVVLPVPAAMVLHAVTQMTSNGWRALLWRAYIDWRIVARYAVGLFPAVAVFVMVDFVPSRPVVLIALGLAPFIAVIVPETVAPRADRRGGAEAAGFVGTAMQLVSGVSGPTLDMFFVRTPLDRRAVVATKAACQVVTHFAKLVYFGGLATDGWQDLDWPIFVLAIGLAMLGTSLARSILERLTDAQFRAWTQRIVMAIGAVYVVLGIRAAL
jgi:uncharacterized protein